MPNLEKRSNSPVDATEFENPFPKDSSAISLRAELFLVIGVRMGEPRPWLFPRFRWGSSFTLRRHDLHPNHWKADTLLP